jgi:NADPH:quinone reductase-like Zn-dependent oxidoreductase
LTEASRLIDEGKLSIHIQKTFPLSATAAAEEFNHAGHAEGKVVVIVSPKANER